MRALFHYQTRTVHHAVGILIISALLSRVLGIVRDLLLANNLGAGKELDVYFAVFRIPDFVYHILISGGIVVAFLPIFSEFFSKNRSDAWKFTNNLLNVFSFFLVGLSAVLFIFTPIIVKLITPGFTALQLEQTIFLTRLMFLSPIFFGLSSILSGVLQYFHRFLFYGLAPIFYNLGIILGILFLLPAFGIKGIIYGVLLGAFMHFAVQLPSAISCGLKYRPVFQLGEKGLKRIFLLMLPRTLGVAGSQINLIVMTSIASTLSMGSISIFNLAQNLQNLPIGIIGVSFAIAVFAPLSKSLADGEKDEFLKNFSSTFRQIIYIIFPLSFLIFFLRNEIVEIVLKHGEFGEASAVLASASLGLFCLGVWAISLIPLLSRAFFAARDTLAPAIIVFLTITVNILLSVYFIRILNDGGLLRNILTDAFGLGDDIRVLGLPLAFAISGILQFALLAVFLYKKIGDFHLKEICGSAGKILTASLFMSAAVYFSTYYISSVFLKAAVGTFVGVSVYFFATNFMKSPETQAIKSKIISRFIKNKMAWRE